MERHDGDDLNEAEIIKVHKNKHVLGVIQIDQF